MKIDLSGQSAIVTGAGRGIGRAIAKRLAAEGAAVTLVARSQNELDAVAAEIVSAGGRAQTAQCDVTKGLDVRRAVETASRLGPVSILVNNAGVPGPFGPIGALDPEEWWRAQEVHLKAPLLFLSAVLPTMRERKLGRIVNVASRGGREVSAHLSAYCVGKASLIRFTEHIAAEGKPFGVVAFSIEPGTVITDMAEATMASPDAQRWLPEMIGILESIKRDQKDPEAIFARAAEMVAELVSGEYDVLSGRYLDPADDFAALARETA
jgi:NAD(P)-dependent dehydrogenase (short-subunit alcohol dehydrogenase family)